jgi:hypothetical protein
MCDLLITLSYIAEHGQWRATRRGLAKASPKCKMSLYCGTRLFIAMAVLNALTDFSSGVWY